MYIYVYVLSDYVINIHILIFSYIHIQHIMYGLSPPINAAMTSKQTSVGHGSSLELSPGIPWSSSLIWLRKRFLPYTGYWYGYTIYCQVASAPKNANNKNLMSSVGTFEFFKRSVDLLFGTWKMLNSAGRHWR